jgi:hypothetical protein
LPNAGTLRFAAFAAPRVVLEIFLQKEKLFARREHKFSGTIDASQYSIGNLHS